MHTQATKRQHHAILALLGLVFMITSSSVAQAETAVINACYNKTNGQLRIIDATVDKCLTSEIAISWSQAAQAFGRITANGDVDLALSHNLSATNVSHNLGGPYCFYNVQAQNIIVTPDASAGLSFVPTFLAAEIGDPQSNCNPGAAAIVFIMKGTSLVDFPFFVLFH
jgi:hypothetical protein